MVVALPAQAAGARISSASPGLAPAQDQRGLVVTVPSERPLGAHHGAAQPRPPLELLRADLRRPPRAAPAASQPDARRAGRRGADAARRFDGQGMWIWYVSQSNGGNVAAIVAQAHAAGVSTVFVKSSDGSSNYWSQFSAAAGRRTARQRPEGVRVAVRLRHQPRRRGEPRRAGGRQRRRLPGDRRRGRVRRATTRAAQTYIADLRAKIGPAYPLGAGLVPVRLLPPVLPLLGVPRAERRAVQRAADVLEGHRHLGRHGLREHLHRQPHLRPPDLPARARPTAASSSADLLRFREEAVDYGATRHLVLGLAGDARQRLEHAGGAADAADERHAEHRATPNCAQGTKGDQVLWLQEHLASAIPGQADDAASSTRRRPRTCEQFQAAHGIPAPARGRRRGRRCWPSRRRSGLDRRRTAG